MVFLNHAFKVCQPLQLVCAKNNKQCFELISIFPPIQGYQSLKNIQATVWQISEHNTLVRCHQFSNFCEIQRKTCSISWACTLNYHTDFKTWITDNYACNCIYV